MLEWSESAPLHVSIKFVCPPEEVTNALYNNSARIVSLRSDNRAVLKKLLSRPMSSLKVLSIGMDGPDGLYDARDIADEPARVVPSLRVLSVENNVEGLGFCTPHLTHFEFHGWYSQETDGKMLLSVLGVFRQCPMLEVVDVGWGEELYNSKDLVFTDKDIISLPHLRYLAQERYVAIDQPWLLELLHLPHSCSIYLRKPPIEYSPDGFGPLGPLSLPYIHYKSPYLSDIKRVKLATAYDRSEDRIEIFLEIVTGQGTLISFRKTVLLEGLDRDPWAIINEDINPRNLCTLRFVKAGSPTILFLDNYQLRPVEGDSAIYIARGLLDLGNVTTLILFNSAIEPCLTALEPDNREKIRWCSTVHTLVIRSPTHLALAAADVLQSLLRVAKSLAVSPEELAALNECIERFELLAGDDALDWDVDRYFIPNYDPLRRRRDESAFDLDES